MSEIKFNDKCVHVVFLGVPNVPGIAAEIFTTLSQHSVSVNMVTQNTMRGGRSDLSFLIDKEKLDEIIPVCREISEKIEGQGVSFATEVAAITVNLKSPENSAKTLAKIFKALASVNVNIEIINSTSESAIFIVSLTKAQEGLTELRETLGEN
ncbi:MAG: ACT domain-containing protein [Synergistaceae bacterium]|nr:ACT domain-containing protein [Synergistaceae bacterium]